MKYPRGNTRKLIIYLGKIQDLVGQAKNIVQNDRNDNLMDDFLVTIDKAFALCLEARNMYAPIDAKKGNQL